MRPALNLCTVRDAAARDAERIVQLHARELEREIGLDRVRRCVSAYPSVAAEMDGRLVGFAYGDAFAPDIVRLANLLVASDLRGLGLGQRMLGAFEMSARPSYGAVILVNSLLYPAPEKRTAVPFYERAGYRQLFETEASAVLAKTLR